MRYFYLIIILILTIACERPPDFEDAPQIEYESYTFTELDSELGVVDGIELTISFEDGDGDLGLAPGDTFPPFQKGIVNNVITNPTYFNFHANLFRKVNGVLIRDSTGLLGIDSRFGYLVDPEDPGPIRGTLTRIVEQVPPLDTFVYEIFIYDRDLNKSNVVFTEEIIAP